MFEICLGFYGGLFIAITPKDNFAFDSHQKYVKCFVCVDDEIPVINFSVMSFSCLSGLNQY